MSGYTVKRSSSGRHLAMPFTSKKGAYQWIGQTLVDNGHATKKEAQQFAATVVINGPPAVHGPYTFTLTTGSTTADSSPERDA